MQKKIVILAGDNGITRLVFNELSSYLFIDKVIIERRVSRFSILKRRIKKLGYLTVFGQIVFGIYCVFLEFYSRARKNEILNIYSLSAVDLPQDRTLVVNSVNDEKVCTVLQEKMPDIVLVFGTRIISPVVLNSTSSVFINIHAGVTPQYRGVHGAYWSLVNRDFQNCGVTLHFVDKGIDTGPVISQSSIELSNKDNFTTYPLIQLGEGLRLLKYYLLEQKTFALSNNSSASSNLKSRLWTHPTIWFYLWHRFLHKIK